MSPLNRTIVAKLKQMHKTLDNIQEIWSVQSSQELMSELGEVMGHIDNAIDVIKKKEKVYLKISEFAYQFTMFAWSMEHNCADAYYECLKEENV